MKYKLFSSSICKSLQYSSNKMQKNYNQIMIYKEWINIGVEQINNKW